jgi:hypothetical protein
VLGNVAPFIAHDVANEPSHAFHPANDASNSVLADIVNPDVVADVIIGIIPVLLGVSVVAYPGIPVAPVGPVYPV